MKHKRLLSVLLAVFILSLSITSSYTVSFASALSDDDIKKYDTIYGVGNWKYDGTTVTPGSVDLDSNPAIGKFEKFLVLNTGICGLGSATIDTLKKINEVGTFAEWVNNNINDINLKDGVLKIGKNALSNWRDVFRNNCYDLGAYRLITNNTSNTERLSIYPTSSMKYDPRSDIQTKVFDEYDSYFYFSGQFHYIKEKDSIKDYFLLWKNFNSSSNYSPELYSFDGYTLKYERSLHYCYYVDGSGYLNYGSFTFSPNSYNYLYHGLPFKIFSSVDSANAYYFGVLNSNKTINVYQYNNYSPTDISINMNTYNNTDYTTINNNIYNEINTEKNTYIENNTTISEEELQKIIEVTIKKYMTTTDNPDSGGDSGGGSSGGSNFDDSTIVEWLKKIYDTLTTSDTRLELMNDILVNTQGFIKSLGEDAKEIITTLTHISDTLDELLDISDDSGGNSIFDLIKKWFLKQLDNFNDLLNNIIGTLIGNLLKDLVDFFIGEDGLTDAVLSPAKALASSAQSKFPTSIPWDVIAIVKVMSAEPETPKFEIPFVIERWNINYTIKIDFEKYEKVADLSRNMLTITFLLFLTIQTRNLYGSLSKN